MGLVSQVFDEPTLATLQGHLAIGHTRYSSTGWENAQPAFKTNAAGGGIALAQNGNFTNPAALARQLILRESPPSWPLQAAHGSSDTDVMADVLAREADLSLEAMTEAAGGARGLCTACFTGDYPIPVDALRTAPGCARGAPQAGHRRHAGAAW
jgi:amidophosphoribosyltransferase